MYSWRVWVLAHAELGIAVFHRFSGSSVFLWIPGGLSNEEFSWQPFPDELSSKYDATPTVGGCVNSNVHSQQEAPP